MNDTQTPGALTRQIRALLANWDDKGSDKKGVLEKLAALDNLLMDQFHQDFSNAWTPEKPCATSAQLIETYQVCINLAVNTIQAAVNSIQRRPDDSGRQKFAMQMIEETLESLRTLTDPKG